MHIEIPILDGKTVEPPTIRLRYATGARQGSEPSQTQSDELLACPGQRKSCLATDRGLDFSYRPRMARQILIHLDLT